jgi:hypothetical protein
VALFLLEQDADPYGTDIYGEIYGEPLLEIIFDKYLKVLKEVVKL